MDHEDAQGVRVYFIDPIESISVIINTLIEIEYEVYTVNTSSKDNLLKVIKNDPRSVIFFCIQNQTVVAEWLKFIRKAQSIQGTVIQLGAFVFDRMDKITRDKFLIESVAAINFGDIKKNSLDIMKKILIFFEAMGKRPYITTSTYGVSDVYFYFKNNSKPIIGKINEISAYALTCKLDQKYKAYFIPGTYIDDVMLVLKGSRIKTSLSVVGFSKEDPNIYMMKYCTTQVDGNRISCFVSITPEMSHKIHDYIRWCLKENLRSKISVFEEKKSPKRNI